MTNEEIIRRLIENGVNAGNPYMIDEVYALDVVWHGPSGQNLEGRDSVRGLVESYLAAFPNLHATIEQIFSAGDWVSLRLRSRGTHTGAFGDIPATGRDVEFSVLVQMRMEAGMIVEEWALFDEMYMLSQLRLGLIEK